MKTAKATTLSIALSGGVLVLLTVSVLQLNALEKRASTQERQLKALGESTEKLVGELGRLKGGGAATQPAASSAGDCEIDKVLHPEVENFLKPRGIQWPPAGAKMNGVLKRGWRYGDPKGFNWMVENAAELRELVINYADLQIAMRNKWTDPMEWHGQAACRVEITDDYKTYTVYLRRGVKWHKPSGVDLADPRYAWLNKEHELTSEDFVFAAKVLMNPQVENGFMKSYFQELDKVEAVDKYTFVVRWKKKTYQSLEQTLSGLQPLPEFLYGYTENGQPIPQETLGLRINQHWYNNKGYVGVGPYRMTEYKPGVRMKFVRNDDFPGDKPAIKEFDFPIYTDRTLSVLKLKSGELNFVDLRPGQYREEVLDWQSKPKASWPKNNPFLNGQIECSAVPSPSFYFIGWNMAKPLFKDQRVRTAMTHAFNRQKILDSVFQGLGEVVSGYTAPASPLNDPTIRPLPFDLDRARALLAEAGWKDSDRDGLVDQVIEGKRTPFEFTLLLYAGSPEWTALANVFKEDLLKIGVKLTVGSVEWSVMQKRMDEKSFDAYSGGWSMSYESDPFQIWHSSQVDEPKGSNRVGFRNKEADQIIEKLRETFVTEERQALFRRLHRILHEAQPYAFFMYQKVVYCWRTEVKNVVFAQERPIADSFPWWVAAHD
ncbi:MAG TPA: ABC transporter substrate-binding protein [Polyangiaceae bacterium]